jgi:hypothetical protein
MDRSRSGGCGAIVLSIDGKRPGLA